MYLDDLSQYRKIEAQNVAADIDGLPEQLASVWEQEVKHPLPEIKDIRRVVISGMGGSAIGADLLAAYVRRVFVHRDYDLPALDAGLETLVVCSSRSGNTDETLSSYELTGVSQSMDENSRQLGRKFCSKRMKVVRGVTAIFAMKIQVTFQKSGQSFPFAKIFRKTG